MISMKKTAALVVIATAALTASMSFAYDGGSVEGLGGGFDADSINHKHGHQHHHHHAKALKKALHTAFKACKAAKVDHKTCAKELTAYISAFKPTAAEATASTPAN